MKFYCEICGKEMEYESWSISPRCVDCLNQIINDFEEDEERQKLIEKIRQIIEDKKSKDL